MKYVQMDLIPDNPLDLLHYKELNHIRNILLNRNHSNIYMEIYLLLRIIKRLQYMEIYHTIISILI